MSEIWDVEMGHVTTRRGARLHLVIAGGRAYCGSGSGTIIASRNIRDTDAPHVCKKCLAALRTQLVDVINVRSRRTHGGSENQTIIKGCEDLIQTMETPAERAEQDEMLENIRRNMHASYASHESEVAPIMAASLSEGSDKLTLF